MFDLDWQGIFVLSEPPLELILRGSLLYIGLFWLLRFILNRHLGTVGAADLLMMLLLANGVQNAFVGQGKSLADALVVVLTVIFWNYTLDWLGFHFPGFSTPDASAANLFG